MMRFAPMAAILLFDVCAGLSEEPVLEAEPIMEEPQILECGDDGIGGTGCPAPNS